MDENKIDVLAVMDEAGRELSRVRTATLCCELTEAREVVEAVIKAAMMFPENPNPYTYRLAHAQLKLALSRVRSS